MEGSRVPSWSQNRSKIDSRRYLKQDNFWIDFGSLLNRFLVDFGGQVGAKLALKSLQEEVNTDVKKT